VSEWLKGMLRKGIRPLSIGNNRPTIQCERLRPYATALKILAYYSPVNLKTAILPRDVIFQFLANCHYQGIVGFGGRDFGFHLGGDRLD
jgi:hypothetical protein